MDTTAYRCYNVELEDGHVIKDVTIELDNDDIKDCGDDYSLEELIEDGLYMKFGQAIVNFDMFEQVD